VHSPIKRYALMVVLAVVTLVLLSNGRGAYADDPTIYITDCTEQGLDAALAQLVSAPDHIIFFNCDGTIPVTRTKLITGSLWLDADNHAVILNGGNALQLFKVSKGGELQIGGLTISGGQTDGLGGGIYNQGWLNVQESVFGQNKHGIVNFGSLTVEGSTFADNRGDGIYNSGELVVTASTFVRNSHGIDNASGDVSVDNSTFADNNAPPGQVGGAIANAGTLTVVNSTFSGNRAPAGGGAIANRLHSAAYVQNTIIANGGHDPNCWGTTFDQGNNLQFPGTTCGSSIPVKDPKLLPLADNGGPTQTMALAADSPAIDAGDNLACSRANHGDDQTFAERNGGSVCDIGAYEFGAIPPPVATEAATQEP